MVFGRISNALSSDDSSDQDTFEGVAGEAMEEYEILKSEYQSDEFFQERIRKLVEEENVSVQNLQPERGSNDKKLGRGVKLLGVIAEGIAIKTVIEVGISNIENDLESAEKRIEAQDTELFQAEDKTEELEIRINELLENEVEDIKRISGLESSISTIENNTDSLASMLEQSSIKNLSKKQNQKLGKQLKTVIQELEEIKQHHAIVSLEKKVQNDRIDTELFQELASEAVKLSKNIELMEKELNNLEKAINLVSKSLDLVENNSEIWIHNESVETLRRNQQLLIVETLEEDEKLNSLSDFSGFNKQDFLTQLATKNPGDLISESQEFRGREIDRFESGLQDLESEMEQLEKEKEEVENQLRNIIQKSSKLIEELVSIEKYIEKLKNPAVKLVESLEPEIAEIEDIEGNLEQYKKKRANNEISRIPQMEKLISLNSEEGDKFNSEGIFQKTDELLRSTVEDFEDLISLLDSVENELLNDKNSLKSALKQLNSLNV